MKLKEYLKENEFDLSLAAGFFGFYSHLGFVKALAEDNIFPQEIYGSSAGAIVGSLAASTSGIEAVEKKIISINFKQVFDLGPGIGLLKGQKYHEMLAEILPHDFSELNKKFYASVFNLNQKKIEIISEGELIKAVRASSAFPGLFQPVKMNNSLYLDGGIGDEYALSQRQQTRFLLVHGFARFPLFQKSYAQLYKQLSPTLFVYADRVHNIGPFNMHKGEEVLQHYYQKAKELLNLNIEILITSENKPNFFKY